MARVQSILWMEQPPQYSISSVRIGLMRMKSKIIHYIVWVVHICLKINFDVWLGLNTDLSTGTMIAFSSVPTFEVRLPTGEEQTSLLTLFVRIRDTRDCVTEFNINSVIVTEDTSSVFELIDAFQNSTDLSTNNPLIQLLESGNQNTMGQILTSISQQLNRMNSDSLSNTVSSKYHSILLIIFIISWPMFRWYSCIEYFYLITRKSSFIKSASFNSVEWIRFDRISTTTQFTCSYSRLFDDIRQQTSD